MKKQDSISFIPEVGDKVFIPKGFMWASEEITDDMIGHITSLGRHCSSCSPWVAIDAGSISLNISQSDLVTDLSANRWKLD